MTMTMKIVILTPSEELEEDFKNQKKHKINSLLIIIIIYNNNR